MTLDPYDDTEAHRQTLALADAALGRYHGRLRTAPDCRDPDHPGCSRCEPDDYPDPWEREPLPHHHEDPLP